MSNLKITIDGAVIMDGSLGEWRMNPPALITDQLKAGAQIKPYMQALLVTVAGVVTQDRGAEIVVTTKPTGGWSIDVA